MIEVFVKRPATTVMLVLFLVLMGANSLSNLNIESQPQIDLPMVSVQVVYPGASPEEVELDVVKPIEDTVSEVAGIKQIQGRGYENAGLVFIEFAIEEDINIKLLEVKDKIEAIQNDLPDAANKPIISKIDILSSPVMTLALSGDNYSMKELYDFADRYLVSQFTAVSGVSTVEIIGGDVREFRIYLDTELMKQQYITITDVIGATSRANISMAGGDIIQSNNAVGVKFYSEFQNIEDIMNVTFTTGEGRKFQLRDIAIVEDTIADRELSAYFNANETVLISIKNAPDGNAIVISDGIQKKLPNIRDNLLLDGMVLDVSNDTSIFIADETNATIDNILLGMLLTVAIILVFTANIRSTIIMALIIPTSLVSAMFFVANAGFTINAMTLLAFASVLGTLIANALIILESALTLIEKGRTPEQAAIEGTKNVLMPVIAASGTNLAVFVPISFMGGIVGMFMVQFGMTVVYTTIVSIVISLSLTPMLIAQLVKPQKAEKSAMDKMADSINNFLVSHYKPLFELIWNHKILASLASLGILISTFFVVPYLGFEFSPSSDESVITVSLKTPQGSTLEKTVEKAREIEDIARSYPDVVTATVVTVGENGTTNASIRIELVDIKDRPMSDLEFAATIFEDTSTIPDISIDITRGNKPSFSADIALNVYGRDYDKIIEYSLQIEKIMEDLNVFRSINSSYQVPKNERRFIPDQEKLNLYGINNMQIASAVRASIYGDTSNKFKDNGKTYDINVLLNEASRSSVDVFENIYVSSPQGLIPISHLGTIKEVPGFSEINRKDKERYIEVGGYLGKSSLGKVQSELNAELAKIDFEEGYGYTYGGNAESAAEANAELGNAFLLAVVLTYMLLAAILNSYLQPFTIATSIVTSFSGVFVMMFFFDATFNIASMLAMIMLIGLSVNNSILIVENAVFKIQKNGTDVKEALWNGYESKTRTIFMTSIAIMLGMLPQLFSADGMKSSMSAVVIGGMIGSLIFTFLLTPVTFYALDKLGKFRLFGKKEEA